MAMQVVVLSSSFSSLRIPHAGTGTAMDVNLWKLKNSRAWPSAFSPPV